MNDYGLLQAVKYGYAIKNGRDELRQIIFCVIGDHNSESLLDTMERLIMM